MRLRRYNGDSSTKKYEIVYNYYRFDETRNHTNTYGWKHFRYYDSLDKAKNGIFDLRRWYKKYTFWGTCVRLFRFQIVERRDDDLKRVEYDYKIGKSRTNKYEIVKIIINNSFCLKDK